MSDPSGSSPPPRLLMGNVACAEGAIAAGCRFYAGYPITPSSEVMERMAQRLPEVGGAFIQMEDEIASISAVVGASWTGRKSMTATSGPGLSLMMEGLGYATWTETPIVIVDVQRAGPATGQATHVGSGDVMQLRYGSHGDYHPIAIAPWSVQDMYDHTIVAFNLAEKYRVPTFVLTDEAVGHLRETAVLDPNPELFDRIKKPGAAPFGSDDPAGVPPMPSYGAGENILVTGSTHDEWGWRKVDSPEIHARQVDRINRKITDHRSEIVRVQEHMLDDAEVVIIAYGFTARSALAAVGALRKEGVKAGLLRLVTVWPLAVDQIVEIAQKVEHIVVPEMNRGQVAALVEQHAKRAVHRLNQTNGKVIDPGDIAALVKKVTS